MRQRKCLVCGNDCGIWLFDTKACQAIYHQQWQLQQAKQVIIQAKSKPKQLSLWSE